MSKIKLFLATYIDIIKYYQKIGVDKLRRVFFIINSLPNNNRSMVKE